jgi:hypothetical protein
LVLGKLPQDSDGRKVMTVDGETLVPVLIGDTQVGTALVSADGSAEVRLDIETIGYSLEQDENGLVVAIRLGNTEDDHEIDPDDTWTPEEE